MISIRVPDEGAGWLSCATCAEAAVIDTVLLCSIPGLGPFAACLPLLCPPKILFNKGL